jgi:ferredoxin
MEPDMANIQFRNVMNVAGRFYVDDACIDCMICKDMAPNNFELDSASETYYVSRQPETQQELDDVIDAMESCPSAAIGDDGQLPTDRD